MKPIDHFFWVVLAERFVGNCRRDLLDKVIVLNNRHLKRLMSEDVATTEDRMHLGHKRGLSRGDRILAKHRE